MSDLFDRLVDKGASNRAQALTPAPQPKWGLAKTDLPAAETETNGPELEWRSPSIGQPKDTAAATPPGERIIERVDERARTDDASAPLPAPQPKPKVQRLEDAQTLKPQPSPLEHPQATETPTKVPSTPAILDAKHDAPKSTRHEEPVQPLPPVIQPMPADTPKSRDVTPQRALDGHRPALDHAPVPPSQPATPPKRAAEPSRMPRETVSRPTVSIGQIRVTAPPPQSAAAPPEVRVVTEAPNAPPKGQALKAYLGWRR